MTPNQISEAIREAVQQEQATLAAMQRAEQRYAAGEISESERREAWRIYFAAGRAAAEALREAKQ